MKLAKAIEILIPLTIPPGTCPDPDINDAIKLGIEALKRERKHREGLILTKPEPLPGETEEKERG